MNDRARPIRRAMIQELQKTVAHGTYVVDPKAVAEAMLARRRIGFTGSGVLVATETLEDTSSRISERESSARDDGS